MEILDREALDANQLKEFIDNLKDMRAISRISESQAKLYMLLANKKEDNTGIYPSRKELDKLSVSLLNLKVLQKRIMTGGLKIVKSIVRCEISIRCGIVQF